ncbi:MAG: hypothetical protein CME70_19625 [Halobacteriovorax sp.]|nr:hypothetical protein [Halobacteriovorax sp.]|tara:strand:+ start:16184 stop:17293 length:1110 start_codon:yes stop_codon:yes gene_type:complete
MNSAAAFTIGEKKSSLTPSYNSQQAFEEANISNFNSTIDFYNSNRNGQRKILNSIKDKKDKAVFREYLIRNRIVKLPKINKLKGKAYLKFRDNLIVFSLSSLAKGELLVNDKLVRLTGNSMSSKYLQYKKELKSVPKFSFLSLFINDAFAIGPSPKLDKLLVATMMKLTTDFEDRGLCAMCDDENEEQMASNFKKVVRKMEEMANKCESGSYAKFTDESEVGRLAYSLDQLQQYKPNISDDYELSELLDKKFKMLENETYKENITCGQLAYLANKTEVHKKFRHLSNRSNNPIAGYLGSTSAGVQEDGDEFERYIGEKCESHARLMACLSTRTDYGKSVYNRDAGRNEYKRIKVGRDVSDSYKHHLILK